MGLLAFRVLITEPNISWRTNSKKGIRLETEIETIVIHVKGTTWCVCVSVDSEASSLISTLSVQRQEQHTPIIPSCILYEAIGRSLQPHSPVNWYGNIYLGGVRRIKEMTAHLFSPKGFHINIYSLEVEKEGNYLKLWLLDVCGSLPSYVCVCMSHVHTHTL